YRVEQAFFGELTVGLKLDLAPSVGDVGESLVAVGAARAVAWEVLGHGDDACVAMRQDKSAGKLGDGVGVGAAAPLPLPDHRVGRMEIEIDHGSEIEIEAGLSEVLGHAGIKAHGGVRIAEARVPADAPSRGNVEVAVTPREPRHQSAFLVHSDERDRR